MRSTVPTACARGVRRSDIGAEIAFQRPEGDDDRRWHAVPPIDARKYRRIGFDQLIAALNTAGGGHAVGEFQEGLGEDALTMVDIHDALIVNEKRRGSCDRALRDALRHRLAFEVGEPITSSSGMKKHFRYFELAKYQSRISSPVQCKTPLNLRV
jgi:hypothetical protein